MILAKEKLSALLDELAKEKTVYVPSEHDGQTMFAPYQPASNVSFGGAKTDVSPKETLFPQTETLYTYEKLGEDVTIKEVKTTTDQIIFGLRSCDAYSIETLDKVFLTRGYVDTPYYERRINTLIVALACTKPDRACFCTSFGIDPSRAKEADIQMADCGDFYAVEAINEKGSEALASWDSFLEPTNDIVNESVQKLAEQRIEFQIELNTDSVKEKIDTLFEDPYWADLSMKCLNCGTCAFVCPTCHCFDMSQQNKGNTGYRFRTWDSCMFTEYSLMAGNHNPRPTKKARLRNRFMHKLSFYDERYGSSMCSGCGRCIEKCPVGIDISRVIEDVQEVGAHD
ncbi:MAG: 4Fe-4S dicluster domain-containing protein [Raoultibacter sp.]